MECILEDVKETVVKRTGEVTISGRLRNLRVKQRGEKWIVEGSLPKFGQDHNLFSLGFHGTVEVVNQLCEFFKVSSEMVDLWGFEFGTSLLVQRSISEYLPLLGKLARFQRLPYGAGSLTYTTRQQILRLYDKLREMSKPDKMLVNSLVPSSMSALKFELELKRHPKEQLGLPKNGKCLSLAESCEPAFYRRLAQFWADRYAQINKIDTMTLSGRQALQDCRTMSETLQWLGMQKMGGQIALLNEISGQPSISKHVKSNMRKHVKSLSRHVLGANRNSLICELDQKVLEVLNEVNGD